MVKAMAFEDVWRREVIDAVYLLSACGSPYTSDDVRKLVREEAPYENAWSSIWSWDETRVLQYRVKGAGRLSSRPAARGHMLSVRRGRPEVVAAAQQVAA